MDLSKLVNEALENIHQEGLVATIVRKKLEKTIESVVDDVLGSYGDFGKSLKEQVKSLLGINLSKIDIPSYNTLVLQIVKEKLDQVTHTMGTEKIKAQMDELLADVKSEYKLSELITKWKEEANEDHDHDGKDFSLHIEKSYTSTWVHLDPEPRKTKHQCEYAALVKDDGTLFCIRVGDRELKTKTMLWGLNGPGEDLFKIYAHGSKLIIDEDEIDLEYSYQYDD